MASITQAIRSLNPNAEFVIKDGNLEKIEWHVVEGKPPTKVEILLQLEKLEKIEIEENEKAIKNKVSARAKLAALGLTPEEISAIS